MAKFFFSCPYFDLLTAPITDDELLAYASCIATRVADGFDVEVTDGTLESNRIGAFHNHHTYWGIGHGFDNLYTVKYGKIFLRTPDISMATMGGRIVHLQSCLTGRILGPDLVRRFGADAFVGYKQVFYLGVSREGTPTPIPGEEPSSDADLYTAPDCDLEIQRQLLNGASFEDAVKASHAKFEREIERYETGDRKDWYIAPHMYRDILPWDMNAQVTYTRDMVVPPTGWAKYGPGLKLTAALGSFGVGMMMLSKTKF